MLRGAQYPWFAIAVFVFCSVGSSADGEENRVFQIGGGRSFSSSHSLPVSYGHAYFVSGEPGFLFGGVQDREEQWELYYLILIKHGATAMSTFHLGNLEPEKSSASSNGKIRLLDFNQELRIDEIGFAYSYKARFNQIKDTLISEEMTIHGKRIDLTDGRVFVVDMSSEPVRVQQVNVKLPSNPNLDFIKSTSEYKLNTNRWLEEVTKSSEFVANVFKE
jgi:hypothetical protein